jgi:hypothetical protein
VQEEARYVPDRQQDLPLLVPKQLLEKRHPRPVTAHKSQKRVMENRQEIHQHWYLNYSQSMRWEGEGHQMNSRTGSGVKCHKGKICFIKNNTPRNIETFDTLVYITIAKKTHQIDRY